MNSDFLGTDNEANQSRPCFGGPFQGPYSPTAMLLLHWPIGPESQGQGGILSTFGPFAMTKSTYSIKYVSVTENSPDMTRFNTS